MKKILLVGAGERGIAALQWLKKKKDFIVIAVVDKNPEAPGMILAESYNIEVGSDWNTWISEKPDIIINATEDENTLHMLTQKEYIETTVVTVDVFLKLAEYLQAEKIVFKNMQEIANFQKLVIDNLQEGIIAVDQNKVTTYVNRSAKEMLDIVEDEVLGYPIEKILSQSFFAQVLQTRKTELHQKVTLYNDRQVLSNWSPLIDESGSLRGAVAVLIDMDKLLDAADQVSGIKEMEKLLEVILRSSHEGITVVNQEGIGTLINPAFTNITGLTKEAIIGKSVLLGSEADKNFHKKVLKTRKPIKKAHVKYGLKEKDVCLHAVPLMVNGKLKGSVGIIRDRSYQSMLTEELEQTKQMIRSMEESYTFSDLTTNSNEMKLAVEQAKVGARSSSVILLRGEKGAGQEVFAHAIHNESHRKNHKFLRYNCSAADEKKIESDWFGSERAVAWSESEKGLFELADKGCVFLEEIEELPLPLQIKLLRILEKNEIVKKDRSGVVLLDVRVIASATNNLEKAVMNGTFSEDLYYRLNRLPVFIPPLRERMEDFETLTEQAICKVNKDYGTSIKGITDEAMLKLRRYEWPGNIRELENIIKQASLLMDSSEKILGLHHFYFPEYFSNAGMSGENNSMIHSADLHLQDAMDQLEENMILTALEKNNGNKIMTAEALGISIRNLYYKMKKYHILKGDKENFS